MMRALTIPLLLVASVISATACNSPSAPLPPRSAYDLSGQYTSVTRGTDGAYVYLLIGGSSDTILIEGTTGAMPGRMPGAINFTGNAVAQYEGSARTTNRFTGTITFPPLPTYAVEITAMGGVSGTAFLWMTVRDGSGAVFYSSEFQSCGNRGCS